MKGHMSPASLVATPAERGYLAFAVIIAPFLGVMFKDAVAGSLVDQVHSMPVWATGEATKVVRTPGDVDHKRIVYSHLHSYGGTSMCQMAKAMGEKTSVKPVCNILSDMCNTRDASRRIPCQPRVEHPFYTFTEMERMLGADDLSCSDALYGVTLRNPLKGVKAVLASNMYSTEEFHGMMEAMRTRRRPNMTAYTSFHVCLAPWDSYQHIDNFATRTIGGNYDRGPGLVTLSDLEMAKARVKNMDVLMILDEFNDHLPQLQYVFGWDINEEKVAHSNSQSSNKKKKHEFSDEEHEFLTKANDWDFKLYNMSVGIARERTRIAKENLKNGIPYSGWGDALR